MRPPRIHIDTICLIVLLVALDLGWYLDSVRHKLNLSSAFYFSDRAFDTSVVPVLNLLIVGLYHIIFHKGRNPFLMGFVISGMLATTAFMLWIWISPDSVADTLMIRPFPGLVRAYRQERISVELFITIGSIIDTSPQLIAALLGGWLAHRLVAYSQAAFSETPR